mmetsp:Transcript_20635/g.49262  ORF Transcript_20635/g.49262 Transcript_20635/m.49262 type:complete len:183 (+) Transcript_20635:104-652(+)
MSRVSTPPSQAGSRRSSPTLKEVLVDSQQLPAAQDSSCMVSGQAFGIPGCTKDDFMELQISVTKAFERAEARAGRQSPNSSDDEFAREVSDEIDELVDDLECLKDLLISADEKDISRAQVEGEVLRLKQKIHYILDDLDEREQTIAYAEWEGHRTAAEGNRSSRSLTRRSDIVESMESMNLK